MNLKRAAQGVFLSFVFLFFAGFFIYGEQVFFKSLLAGSQSNFFASVSNATSDTIIDNNQIAQFPQKDSQAQNLEINAESAISVESNLSGANRTLFEKNSGLKQPIASLTKLMTAVISLDNYDLLQKITVSKKADSQDPMRTDLKLGDTFSVTDILYIMLVESSNKAAYALSEQMGEKKFVALMNQKAAELGLKNTFYADPTGLSSENVSTAEDLTKFAEYILKNYPVVSQISRTKEYEVLNFGKIENTNLLLGEVPEVILGKTGFTIEAKGSLLLAVNNLKNNDYLINVILGADDRFGEMKKLIQIINQ